jgi:hypothetical protein
MDKNEESEIIFNAQLTAKILRISIQNKQIIGDINM